MTHIFISHATADDGFVADLRRGLAGQRLAVWVDSRSLRGGDRLEEAIRQAIVDAAHCIVVLSPQTVNSPWVRREIGQKLAVQDLRPDYRVIPLLLPGIAPAALALWFEREPVAVPIALGAGGVVRATAVALLRFQPAAPQARAIESRRYTVTAPLGAVELNDLRWYLEEFALWPVGVFAQRAAATETDLPGWGQALYAAAWAAPPRGRR